eukprot:NODE_15656_length_1038_cov_3.680571.p1 GENE.NODE_15656_length_1038_cov_3.680571~~NODE_15656_length_1038_cov_3.680571.p1  ORF type:complete len:130 (+),score=1.97 NODE_15656_length_1038_cov_3.680571:599-988(+)
MVIAKNCECSRALAHSMVRAMGHGTTPHNAVQQSAIKSVADMISVGCIAVDDVLRAGRPHVAEIASSSSNRPTLSCCAAHVTSQHNLPSVSAKRCSEHVCHTGVLGRLSNNQQSALEDGSKPTNPVWFL